MLKFKNSEVSIGYKAIPFLSVNDTLDVGKIRKVMKFMKEQGLGGFFFHARLGLDLNDYLSENWKNFLDVIIDEAKRLDMEIWLYDEFKWPSGTSAGKIPKLGEKFRNKMIVCEEINKFEKNFLNSVIKCYSTKFHNKTIEKYNEIPYSLDVIEKEIQSGNKIVVFYKFVVPLGDPFFNNASYIDTLDPAVVKKFIETTYEWYKKYFGNEFGKRIKGIFTDEPCYLMWRDEWQNNARIPYTDNLIQIFREKKGYDFTEKLISLFYETEDSPKLRYDYWEVVTEIFTESFTKQIYNWCCKNSLLFTGHIMAEDNIASQVAWTGDVMAHYEYMHIPGIDHLGRKPQNLITGKQVTSVAHQLNRKRVLCEIYGGGGQGLTLEDRLWIGNSAVALGINFLNHHLYLYSLRGKRKRDYPPTISHHQPYWNYNKIIENYFTKICSFISNLKFINEVLIIHPMRSGWILWNPFLQDIHSLDDKFYKISRWFMDYKIPFDFGSETLIKKYGKVDKQNFCIGKMRYNIVVLPSMLTISSKLFSLLEQFIANNGKLIIIKPYPLFIDGKKDNTQKLEKLIENSYTINFNKWELWKIFKNLYKPEIIFNSDTGEIVQDVYFSKAKKNRKIYYFLANIDKDFNKRISMYVLLKKYSITKVQMSEKVIFKGSTKSMDLCLAGGNLLVIEISETEKREKHISLLIKKKVKKVNILYKKWEIIDFSPNIFIIDYGKLSIDSKEYDRMPIIFMKNFLEKRDFTKFCIESEFILNLKQPLSNIYLVYEDFGIEKIFVNSKKLFFKSDNFFIDESMKKLDISKYLIKGRNNIKVVGKKLDENEPENFYIIGKFGVKKFGQYYGIDSPPHFLLEMDFKKSGFPFFSGEMKVANKILVKDKKPCDYLLKFESLPACLMKVFINNKQVGLIYKKPYELIITDFINQGENSIELVLINTLKNMFGPHHNIYGEKDIVSPWDFKNKIEWIDYYDIV